MLFFPESLPNFGDIPDETEVSTEIKNFFNSFNVYTENIKKHKPTNFKNDS